MYIYIYIVLDSNRVTVRSQGDMTLDAYLGIPYAKFVRRFDKAQYPHPPWDNVYNATDRG